MSEFRPSNSDCAVFTFPLYRRFDRASRMYRHSFVRHVLNRKSIHHRSAPQLFSFGVIQRFSLPVEPLCIHFLTNNFISRETNSKAIIKSCLHFYMFLYDNQNQSAAYCTRSLVNDLHRGGEGSARSRVCNRKGAPVLERN